MSLAVKQFVKRIDVLGLRHVLFNKYHYELDYQKRWAKTFLNSKDNWKKLRDLWTEFYCLNEIIRTCYPYEFTARHSMALDVGCGVSSILHFVPGRKFGIDPLADEYKKFYDYPKNIHIRKGFAEKIPFVDNQFHIIFCTNVLDHVSNPLKALNEMNRVLGSSGKLVLLVETFDSRRKRDKAHPFSFTKDEVHSLVGSRFKILQEFIRPWIAYDFATNEHSLKNSSKSLILIATPLGDDVKNDTH